MAKENREHKDSVFTDLFCKDETAKENLLELHNALYDTNDTDPELIKVISLEDVLFKNLKNDVAFTYREDKDQLQKAVKECIEKGILSDYLLRKSSEVVNMLMAEYDYEMDIEVQREEASKKADDKRFAEDVDKIIKKMHISPEKACQILDESYEKYLEIKEQYTENTEKP